MRDAQTKWFMAAFKQFDDIEQLIIRAAIDARVDGWATLDEAPARMKDQVERHRRGEEIYLSKLEIH